MKTRRPTGFALVITVLLLGLLVLALFALSALTKVANETATSAVFQTQARQHALVGLGVALGELQRLAGEDGSVTGMAGITGVSANAAATTRYWCGVWRVDGGFLGWLASGAGEEASVGGDSIELVSAGTVGAASSTSANVEKEHVIAGKVPVVGPADAAGGTATAGAYAYLVIDEGIKIGAYAPIAERAGPGAPAIGASMLTNQLKLKNAIEANAATVASMVAYEQLGLLPGVTPSVIQDTFHYVTLTPRVVTGNQYRSGVINVNTSSALVWRSLLDTYNEMPGVTRVPNVTSRGNQLANNFAATTVGKAANAPFVSLDGFAAYLGTIFPANGSPTAAEIVTALGPMLTVRSDTFRIRAYGDSVNPADATRVEAIAYCEAIVQRTPLPLPGFGRRFVVTSFRWLGPDDI